LEKRKNKSAKDPFSSVQWIVARRKRTSAPNEIVVPMLRKKVILLDGVPRKRRGSNNFKETDILDPRRRPSQEKRKDREEG